MKSLLTFLSFLGLALGTTATLTAAEPAKKPNVLFLFADDQRTDTIAALGNPVIKTPNLDALVQRGFVFHNAYCFGSNVPAVCSPSRNMLMCGQSYFRFQGQASPDKPNFPTSLKQAGYVTYHHGKRGNTALAVQKLFDHDKYVMDEADRKSGEPGKAIVDDAIAFLKGRQDDKPFFMYLAFANPHDPRVAAKRYMDLYARKDLPLPKNFKPFHTFDNGELKVRDEKLAAWPRTEDEVRAHLHDYYAVITGLDENIGRLIKHLKDQGQLDNTVVIFSADHGLAMGSHGLIGKQSLYEHSMKAPLIFAGPGIPKGQSEAFAYLFDLFPTVCDLVGTPVPEGLDGKSLVPVIQGKKAGVRDAVLTAYRDSQRAVRQGSWKLIRYPQVNKTQLFDLARDPDETKDLADDHDQVERVKSLTALMLEQQKLYGDKQPLTVDKPKPAEVDLSFFK